ncbi:2-succinylbenzoate--CoA ligase [Forsythia ovata]|uniref:2-succinylbenzoate--CoA ligase n=1 Tax=Forsythia ovata TaxID=205694 RepID=A0ABD1R6Y9_9LAMI
MANYSESHICQCLSRLSTLRRNSTVTIMGDRRKTGMQFVDGVLGLACGLIQLGIKPGHVVSISALNSDLYLEWMLAIAYVGGIAAPLNYRWGLEEAKLAMEVVQPVLLVTDLSPGYWHSAFHIDSVPSLQWHILMDTPVRANYSGTALTTELLKKPTGRSVTMDYIWAPERAAIICFTSGTTGRPKGATISHSALVIQSLAKIATVHYDEEDVYLHTVPLCHIGGISSAMAMLIAGGCHVIIPKFEAKLAIECIGKHHVTSFLTVPTIMADLISSYRMKVTSEQLETVMKILNGGGALSAKLIEDGTKIFPRAELLSAYVPKNENNSHQLSDAAKSNFSCPGGVCVGKPAPHIEVRISVEDSLNAGRILTRGPHVMLGYWGQIPSKCFDPGHEGWFDTGDIGQIDDHGRLWLIGRAKDRIKSGGENIYPDEVEVHPWPTSRDFGHCCCWSSRFSVDRDAKDTGNALSSEILRNFCRAKNLTGFKIPKKFVLLEEYISK